MRIPRGGLIPINLKRWGWHKGSSTNSRICAICFLQPPMSSCLHHSSLIPRLRASWDHPLKIKFVETEKCEVKLQNLPVWIQGHSVLCDDTKFCDVCFDDFEFHCLHATAVSPFRTGQYAAQTTKSVYGHPTGKCGLP